MKYNEAFKREDLIHKIVSFTYDIKFKQNILYFFLKFIRNNTYHFTMYRVLKTK